MSEGINVKKFYSNILRGNPLLYDHQFIVTFDGDGLPEIFKANPSNPKCITYYVKSSAVPKIDIQEQTVNFMSQKFVVPGGVIYDESWNVKVMLTNGLDTYLELRNWVNVYSDISKNGGGIKGIPNIRAHVHLLDSSMQNEIQDFVLEGVFPTEIPDIDMKYENQSTIKEIDVKFVYQYMYRAEEGDPLNA